MKALFSSVVGGERLRERVLDTLAGAVAAGGGLPIDVHIMTFSFTDTRIALALRDLATRSANVTIRIIADWGQGARHDGRQVGRLASLNLSNLLVRYKNDQPYEWDADGQRLRWSYRASRGLLHHKTLGVFIDGSPWALVGGSFNWTGKAANSYENLLIVTAEDSASADLMRALEWEFEAMWSDGRATLSPVEAQRHYELIRDEFRRRPGTAPESIVGLGAGAGASTPVMGSRSGGNVGGPPGTTAADPAASRVLVAFNSRAADQARGDRGYSRENSSRRFDLRKPGGATKRVPLTITNAALDVIARAEPGDTLKVAMYGLSPRVPEYGALLEAARRGVRLDVLLDGRIGGSVRRRLVEQARNERLPIEVRGGRRMMHQKYIVHPETDTVLTGTANLSTDASSRHSEHVIVVRHDPALAASFIADFTAIWSRLSPQGS